MKEFTAIVLAAGKGRRMKNSQPKALIELAGRPLVFHVLKELISLKRYIKQIIVVTGHKAGIVEGQIKKDFSLSKPKISFIRQSKMLGTANAVGVTRRKIKKPNLLVVCADTPLIKSQTLGVFIGTYLRKSLSALVLTADLKEKSSLGIIIRDSKGNLRSIQERISSSNNLAKSYGHEVNSGMYCFKTKALLQNLPKIKPNNQKKEYFLTDIIDILYQKKERIDAYSLGDRAEEIFGINSQQDLCLAEDFMRQRLLSSLMDKGVKILDPKTTFVQEGVKIGKNTLIYPFTFIEKGVIIGSNCSLGPFLHLRKGVRIGANSQVGNFLEINRTVVGKGARIKHFCYLGDAKIGDNVNIGAGTVVANFDGKLKHKTQIGDNALIGSNTVLVAPVNVGKAAKTGAGSVVIRDVKPNAVVVGIPAKPLKRKRG